MWNRPANVPTFQHTVSNGVLILLFISTFENTFEEWNRSRFIPRGKTKHIIPSIDLCHHPIEPIGRGEEFWPIGCLLKVSYQKGLLMGDLGYMPDEGIQIAKLVSYRE